jgi:hypothetical protein
VKGGWQREVRFGAPFLGSEGFVCMTLRLGQGGFREEGQ